MKFIVDAQLPRLLAIRLRELGQEATHTLDLDAGNRTQDNTIANLAELFDLGLAAANPLRQVDRLQSLITDHRSLGTSS
jgi:hypothetical protein